MCPAWISETNSTYCAYPRLLLKTTKSPCHAPLDARQSAGHQQLHWAFYSFREDSWDGMDYELGSAKVPWRYWQAIENAAPDPLPRKATAEFEPIRQRLLPKPTP